MERVSHIAEIAGLKEEARRLGFSSVEERNEALSLIAHGLERDWESIKAANDEDVAEATDAGVAAALVKRLVYSETKQREAQNGIADVMALGDPIGRVRQKRELDEGLILTQVTVPIGVIGMIFEARPDALVQIVTLCLKSGNAIILKGGSEARRTNAALVASMRKSLEKSRLASGWIVLLESRSDVSEMLTMEDSIDLLIPRGSKEFVSYIMSHTAIPVLGHADGICHLYIDERADLSMALAVAYDAKTQYPAACNAVETILVHQQIAAAFIPALKRRFGQDVVIHGDERCAALIDCIPYQDGDYDTEYLDMAVNIRVVDSIDEAIAHIARHGQPHRCHRHRRRGGEAYLPRPGGQRRRLRQLLHPLRRWLSLRPGGRGGHLYPEDPRPWPGGHGGVAQHQIPARGEWPDRRRLHRRWRAYLHPHRALNRGGEACVTTLMSTVSW